MGAPKGAPVYKAPMILTRDEIMLLLERLAEGTVVEPSQSFPYRIVARQPGWSSDLKIGDLQAKLSIMLEMTPK